MESTPGGRPGELETFGQKIAHNDLFSKIEFLGHSRVFERSFPEHPPMSDSQYVLSVLLSQMYQMSAEFKVVAVNPIVEAVRRNDSEISLDVKAAFQAMVDGEKKGFWRAGMPPCATMMTILGASASLRETLMREIDNPNFLANTLRLIQATTINSSFTELSSLFPNRG
jgi:hypothetical protein